jgi:hypothetical protein
MNAQERSALLAARAAIICAILTIAIQAAIYFLDVHDKHKQELMDHRRQALFSALEVVDHVYANSAFDGKPPSHPQPWDISSARTAMSGMMIYCKDPNRAVAAFSKAIGLYNPNTEIPPGVRVGALQEFRDVISDELEAPPIRYADSNMIWISELPGAK